jgi:hypothetical protein
MIRTPGSIATDIYKYVMASALAEAVNGEVLKSRDRKPNSKTEDVVIKVLANMPAQKQQTVINVNIYIPDFVNEDGQYEKDGERCDDLEAIAAKVFEVFHLNGARVILDSQTTMQEDNANAHGINNRLLYTVINE